MERVGMYSGPPEGRARVYFVQGKLPTTGVGLEAWTAWWPRYPPDFGQQCSFWPTLK